VSRAAIDATVEERHRSGGRNHYEVERVGEWISRLEAFASSLDDIEEASPQVGAIAVTSCTACAAFR
jgi:hypothetical protein